MKFDEKPTEPVFLDIHLFSKVNAKRRKWDKIAKILRIFGLDFDDEGEHEMGAGNATEEHHYRRRESSLKSKERQTEIEFAKWSGGQGEMVFASLSCNFQDFSKRALLVKKNY